jgi:TolA-binding protein
MAFSRRWLLVLFALVLGGGPLLAAGTREDRDYAAAVKSFQDGMWSRAEMEFGQFVNKYRESTNAPMALLLEAQAQFKQGKFTNTIALLTDAGHLAKSGTLTDQYAYWIGEAQFQNADAADAAETFVSLTRDFPESSRRLRAAVGAAAAFTQLTNWSRHDALLENPDGVFQQAARLEPGNKLVLEGQLSLENSKFRQRDFPGVVAVYELLTNQWQALDQNQRCQGDYLFYRAKMGQGDYDAALAAANSLAQIAGSPTNQDWLATARAAQGAAFEQLGPLSDAVQAWQNNLTNAPPARVREAILRIAELEIAQGQLTNAANFLAQFPESLSADIALLTAGELHLKDYDAAQPEATNELSAARDCFDRFLGVFTNSPLSGKAYLDRGWCGWLANDMTNSLADFQKAASLLPVSEDLAVARFKAGDAMFALTNYSGALENYRAVLDDFTGFPAVAATLGDRALYQMLRANLQVTNYDAASNAMTRILTLYPGSNLARTSMLLYGEGLADARRAADARAAFRQFLAQFPGSPLRPQVEFAIARTCELEQNWPDAIAGYQAWLDRFPTNQSRAQAIYALARADSGVGNETNAFNLFTNFIAQFPADDLAPQAQWWVADHFFNGADYVDAERNYKLLYQNTNWQGSPLIDPALMMAGRSAVARQGYSDAIGYFRTLEADTNCLMDLRVQAAFAHGAALMQMDSADTNNPMANFALATNKFAEIIQRNPTNEAAALAWLEIGKCELQLTDYDAATNAYAQILDINVLANISLRSQAQIGAGIVLEKKAALASGDAQKGLLELALDNYVDVLHEDNLRDGETADLFWVKTAGLQAAALAETLGRWETAADIYGRLEILMPQLSGPLERKIAAANAHLPPKNN